MKAINLQTMDKVVSDNYDQNYPTIPNYTIHFLFLFEFYFIELIQTKKKNHQANNICKIRFHLLQLS